MLNALTAPLPMAAGLKIKPGWGWLPDGVKAFFEDAIGATLAIGIALGIIALIVSIVVLAIGKMGGNAGYQKGGTTGLLVSIGALILLGGAAAFVAWGLEVGSTIG